MAKRDYVMKTMYKIHTNDGTLTKDYREILNEQLRFYEELYTSNPAIKFSVENRSGIFLDEHEKARLDAPITVDEIFDALKSMKENKAPGLDGLTKEFYVKFFEELKDPLIRLYYHSLQNRKLNFTSRKGVIQLIPKRNKDELYLRNWRPLTLLCLEYKILARTLAIRMESVMDQLIGPQQTGFMKGRNIAHNILKTKEIIANSCKHNQATVIISIDFEKCFDRVEYCAIQGSLKYFNFGDNFINWIFLLFNDFNICTKNNGYFSKFTKKTCGVNQGCPASPGLYNLNGEVMAHMLLANSNIKGISVNNVLHVLSQFADDTAIYTTFDECSINAICSTMQHIEDNTGLKISYEKTNVYRIGSLAKTNAQMYTTQNLKWTDEDIQMLGVTISCDDSPFPMNFNEVISKVKAVLSNWYNKTCTLMGKVLIINSLVSSLFVYKMRTMSDLTTDQIKIIEKEITSFLWNGKRARIALDTLTKDRSQGGLRLVDLKAKQKTLKIKWIFTIEQDQFLRSCLYAALDPNLDKLIWSCNLHKDDVKLITCKSYWQEILIAWCHLNYHVPMTKDMVLKQVIWYNSHIQVGNKPTIFKRWLDKGIIHVKDICNEEGSLLSLNDFCAKFPDLPCL